jgi:hypothetical protein
MAKKKKQRKKATELEYLKYFHEHTDFGPADGDCRDIIAMAFKKETGKDLPEGYDDAYEDLDDD